MGSEGCNPGARANETIEQRTRGLGASVCSRGRQAGTRTSMMMRTVSRTPSERAQPSRRRSCRLEALTRVD